MLWPLAHLGSTADFEARLWAYGIAPCQSLSSVGSGHSHFTPRWDSSSGQNVAPEFLMATTWSDCRAVWGSPRPACCCSLSQASDLHCGLNILCPILPFPPFLFHRHCPPINHLQSQLHLLLRGPNWLRFVVSLKCESPWWMLEDAWYILSPSKCWMLLTLCSWF